MKKIFPAAILATAFLLLAGGAFGEISQKGNLRVKVEGELSPRRLPRAGVAPVSVSVSGAITTTDKTPPPQLQVLTIDINRHGRFDSQGMPVCRIGQIQPASDEVALSECRSSLVGSGSFKGTIALPGPTIYPLEGRLLLFNGRQHGHPVLLGHVFSDKPFFTSFVIVFTIAKKPHGTYGTVLKANVGEALGSKKSLTALEMTLGRRFSYKGQRRSYISAGCPAPSGFNSTPFPLARLGFSFADGRKLTSVLNRTCGARG